MTAGVRRPVACVVGGGVIGLTSALALLDRGFAVTLIDADRERRAASWGNAGHIAVEQVEPMASWSTLRSMPARLFSLGGPVALPAREVRRWAPFGARLIAAARPARFVAGRNALSALAAQAMPAWCRLAARLGVEGLLRQEGHLVLWDGARAARAGRARWAAADLGTARLDAATAADRAALSALPRVDPALAMRIDGTAQIGDLDALADALERAVATAGGVIVRGAARVVGDGSRAAIVHPDGTRTTPDLLLVAAGARTAPLLTPLGHRVPLIAERGYHIRTIDHDWPAELPPLVFEERSVIVTHYARSVQVAGFVELADVDAAADPAKWARLERHVGDLGLPLRPPFVRWMGARPTLPDYLPAIGRSTRATNLLYAFGHQHLGLTLAAVTGELVAAMASGSTPTVDLAPFHLDRFARRRHSSSG